MKTTPQFTAAANVLDLSGDALPTRIELMPLGDVTLQDVRGHVGKVTDGAALIARTMAAAKGGMLPIDFGHGMDGNANADPRAAGWITALEVIGERIMATVEWSSVGAEALQGKVYRFISPTFTVPTGGKELGRILRAGLTNDPALPELAQIASHQENEQMPKWMTDLAAKLGMPDETDEAKIMASANGAIDQATFARAIVTAAGLTGDLTQIAATAITTKITASAVTTPDPALYVPISAVTALSVENATLKAAAQNQVKDTLVADAITAGKLPPALKEWGENLAATDPEGFKTFVAGAVPIVDGTAVLASGKPPSFEGALTAEEQAVCAATGIDEAAFLATKSGKALPKAEGKA